MSSKNRDPERVNDANVPDRIVPLAYGYLIGADYLLNGKPVTAKELAEYLNGLGHGQD